jgi:hypothetical protein
MPAGKILSFRLQNSTNISASRVGSSLEFEKPRSTLSPEDGRKIIPHLMEHVSNARDNVHLELALHLPNHELFVQAVGTC